MAGEHQPGCFSRYKLTVQKAESTAFDTNDANATEVKVKHSGGHEVTAHVCSDSNQSAQTSS